MLSQSELGDSEYGVVSLRINWGWLSIAIFGMLLLVRWWASFLPWTSGAIVLLLLVLGLASLGTLVGWLASRGGRRGAARVGLMLNGFALLILFLLAAVFSVYYAFV